MTRPALIKSELVFLCFLLIYSVYACGSRLIEGLSLDETNTYVLITGSWTETIIKTLKMQHNSPLYFLLVKGWAEIAGSSEIILRMLSLFCSAGSVLLMYLLVLKLSADKRSSVIAALFLLTSNSFIAVGFQARTYSLTLFLLMLTLYWIVAFYQHRSFWVWWIILNTLIVSGHYFAIQIFPLEIFLIYLMNQRKLPRKPLLVSTAIIILLGIIHLPQIDQILHKTAILKMIDRITLQNLFQSIIGPTLFMGICSGLIFLKIFEKQKLSLSALMKNQLILIGASWTLSCVCCLLVLSFISKGSLLIERYYFFALTGNALIFAGFLQQLAKNKLSEIGVYCGLGLFMGINVFYSLSPFNTWRDLVSKHNHLPPQFHSCKLINVSAYVESQSWDLIKNPYLHEYFASQFQYYRVPNQIINFPLSLPGREKSLAENYLAPYSSESCLITTWFYNPFLAEMFSEKNLVGGDEFLGEWARKQGFTAVRNFHDGPLILLYYVKQASIEKIPATASS